jgi:NAD(P) transhydrogenase
MPDGPRPTAYDLVVIGTGPAGEKAAVTAAVLGKRVAVIERETVVGGASANTGTLPSKTLRETALALSGLQARRLYGVDLSLRREATVADLMFHERRVIRRERARVLSSLRWPNLDLFQGAARFIDPHTIAISSPAQGIEYRVAGEKVLIATGSAPFRPPGFDFADPRIHDSDEILALERLPGTLAVVGAGVIGSEYACTFAALGCRVVVIDGRDGLLPFLDSEIAAALTAAMGRLGITFHFRQRVESCAAPPSGPVALRCESGLEVEVDQVLVASGRVSNTAALDLAAAGITPGERGLIKVDAHGATEVPHIYAAGDVIGFPALAATSAEQGRMAVLSAFGLSYAGELSPVLPTGIYTIPEVGCVGETEDALKGKGVSYVAGRASYGANARGQIIGDESGLLKLLFTPDGSQLLGAHVIGEHASELIHVALITMLTGQGLRLLDLACFNYPTLGDLYKYAAFDVLVRIGRDRGIVPARS